MSEPIYQFTYVNSEGLPFEQVQERVQRILAEESLTQGWIPGWTVHLINISNREEGFAYHFEVRGQISEELRQVGEERLRRIKEAEEREVLRKEELRTRSKDEAILRLVAALREIATYDCGPCGDCSNCQSFPISMAEDAIEEYEEYLDAMKET